MIDEDPPGILPWLRAFEYAAYPGDKSGTPPPPLESMNESYSFLFGATSALLNNNTIVVVGGREGLSADTFSTSATLALFDTQSNHWLVNFDIDGSLPRRIGHTVISIGQNAFVFGGESLDEPLDPGVTIDNCGVEHPRPQLYGDFYELSYNKHVLRCQRLGVHEKTENEENDADSSPEQIAPPPRAWHASAAVKLNSAIDIPDGEIYTPSYGMLVIGGKDAAGDLLSDIWRLTMEPTGHKWVSLSTTGASPLPLAFHQAIPVGDGTCVALTGGVQQSSEGQIINNSLYVLDVTTNAWSTLVRASDVPETCALGRCCATAVRLILPVANASSQPISRITDESKRDQCESRDRILIFGGYSTTPFTMDPTSWLLVDPTSGAIETVSVPNAGIKSSFSHATVTTDDFKSLYVFGGIAQPENVDQGTVAPSQTRHQKLLDLTFAFHFWRETPILPEEEEAAAKRRADANPIKTRTLSNGDVYVGEMDDAQLLRHGKGKCTYHSSGDIYEGEWREDHRCGHGTLQYGSGDVYSGEWQNDQREGYGVLDFAKQTENRSRFVVRYEGEWANDKQHGPGIMRYSDGSIVAAEWVGGVLPENVSSKIEGFDDGLHGVCTYVGQVRDGVPHGHGESQHHKSREVYVGGWENGKRSGRGRATLMDGTTYDGEWRNGKRNGFGTCSYARTRDRYDGKWVGDVRCGRGVCVFANGCRYDGEWKNDQCHGTGRYTFADRSFYEGEWRENRFHGDGSFVLCMDDIHSQSTASLRSSGSDA